MGKKFVYLFSEGNDHMRELLGGKGANLAEMTLLGMPVPQGFTITTEACTQYYADNETINDEIQQQIMEYIGKLEEVTGKKFGDTENPLLVSVRSGSRASMPGMMDTILNLGLNDVVVEIIAKKTGNPRFAYDSYRRFIQMYSDVVMGVGKKYFEKLIDELKAEKGVKLDTELTADDLKRLAEQFKAEYKSEIGKDFPTDPKEQLIGAVEAVFRSWNNERAVYYRKMNDIPSSWGTAVNIQSMVFGNMGETSGTGVAFTRNPATGENKLFGEFLMNAQGEDVVAGVRTPRKIDQLKEVMPEVYDEFVEICNKLENHYKDMQDMEFTIEDKKLYMLQTRNGKRTAKAALKIACDLIDEGLIDEETALCMINPKQLDALLHPQFDDEALKKAEPVAVALAASPGAACGQIVFTAEDAVAKAKAGDKVVLVRLETSPEDIEGMVSAQGILTARGGMTSHAAVVARGMGKCCVAGCGEIKVSEVAKTIEVGDMVLKEGDYISLDGSTGVVYLGNVNKAAADMGGNFEKLMSWVDEIRQMKVRTNADNPRDAKAAVDFGAEGIGLCRTEHMFFDEERIPAVRKMILSNTVEERVKALDTLLPMQQKDFEDIYRVMGERPVNIRLLDPPLHEFLPQDDETIAELAKDMGIEPIVIKKRCEELAEFNPMLGHRGCRLAVTYPEIAVMQTKAIINAAIAVNKEGLNVEPEIMIPLVGALNEFRTVKQTVVETADEVIKAAGVELKYTVGTMIEIPRACLIADEIAQEADFFSFGTNDLTQMTFGYSRDDAGKFLGEYVDREILEKDPFQVLDQHGVGKLVQMASKLARGVKGDNIKLGICGEHGGEPSSVEFCYNTGLNYVSCSPYRVPIARLAAARATIKNPRK